MKENKKLLCAALDWGWGHTIRCIPLLRNYQQQGYEIILAGSPQQQSIWKEYFPEVNFTNLSGYNMYYAKNSRYFGWVMFKQIPKTIYCIIKEYLWLKKYLKKHRIDLVISDNRYGFYHNNHETIFITHQLYVPIPNKWLRKVFNKILHYYLYKNFSQIDIPDVAHESLCYSGNLSHPIPNILKDKTKYIGILSRYEEKNLSPLEKKYKAIFVLSGPEPQRTLLEINLIKTLATLTNHQFVLVRGLSSISMPLNLPENWQQFNQLQKNDLLNYLAQAEWIVCRSGYTSVMEMLSLKLKCCFVPTPGQSEQQYLADYLGQKKLALSITQENLFDLNSLLSVPLNRDT